MIQHSLGIRCTNHTLRKATRIQYYIGVANTVEATYKSEHNHSLGFNNSEEFLKQLDFYLDNYRTSISVLKTGSNYDELKHLYDTLGDTRLKGVNELVLPMHTSPLFLAKQYLIDNKLSS